MATDAFGRRIDYLRISVTDRCNLRCVYCMPPDGVPWKAPEEMLTFEEMAPDMVRTIFDLARQDPVGELVRAVGPNLVVALPKPKARENFYRDIFVVAYRLKPGATHSKGEEWLLLRLGRFTVEFDAGSAGRVTSGKHEWSHVTNGFDPANLGQHAQLFIQGSDTNGNDPAILKVQAVEVHGRKS